jgi:hypothetical protein
VCKKTVDALANTCGCKADMCVVLFWGAVVVEDGVGNADGQDTSGDVLHGSADLRCESSFIVRLDQNEITAGADVSQGSCIEGGDCGAVEDGDIELFDGWQDIAESGADGDDGCAGSLSDDRELTEANWLRNGII